MMASLIRSLGALSSDYRRLSAIGSSWFRIAVLLFTLVTVMSFGTPASASNPPTWGTPTSIGANLPSSWFPDINVDPTGTFRIAWAVNLSWDLQSEDRHELSGAVMVDQLGQDGWSNGGDIRVMDSGVASRPLLASDGTYVYMLYRTNASGTTTLNVTRAQANADLSNSHSWTDETPLSTDAYYAQITALPDRSLVVVYNEPVLITRQMLAQTETPLNRRNLLQDAANAQPDPRPVLFSRRSTDQGLTWSAPVRISAFGPRVGRVALTSSPDGSVLIACWDQGYDNLTGIGDPYSVGTAVSTDGGKTWGHVQTITSPEGPIEESVAAINGSTAVLAYRSTVADKIYYRVSEDKGVTWSADKAIPDVIARPYLGKHNFDKMSMAVDGDGRILLAYVGKESDKTSDLSVMVATFADKAWTTPTVVSTPVGFAEYPRIAVGLGNQLEIVYFVRDNEFDLGHYTLWSVSGKSDAKSIPPITPAVAPVPTVTAVPTAAVAPQPTVAAQSLAPPTRTFSLDLREEAPGAIQRNPIVQAVLASLVAIVGLLILSNMLRFVRDRLG